MGGVNSEVGGGGGGRKRVGGPGDMVGPASHVCCVLRCEGIGQSLSATPIS